MVQLLQCLLLLHGNGEDSKYWDNFIPKQENTSVFTADYLSPSEKINPGSNFHSEDLAKKIRHILQMVLKKCSHPNIMVVAHSLGATLFLKELISENLNPEKISKIVVIGAALKGIPSCAYNPLLPTCFPFDIHSGQFGFYPWLNPYFSYAGELSFSEVPKKFPEIKFIAIGLRNDDLICRNTYVHLDRCQKSSFFNQAQNVENHLFPSWSNHLELPKDSLSIWWPE